MIRILFNQGMFYNSYITYLDVSNIDFSTATDYYLSFYDIYSLEELYLGDFSTSMPDINSIVDLFNLDPTSVEVSCDNTESIIYNSVTICEVP